MNKSQVKACHREVEILAQLNHPNIVKYYECYEDKQYMFIVMELVRAMSLTQKMNQRRFTEYGVAVVMKQLFCALEYIHSEKVSHRDVKPDNILIDEVGKITLIDFGLSKNYEKKNNLKTCAGTPMFMPPEMRYGVYSDKCDMWSSGITMYFLLTGIVPIQKDLFDPESTEKYNLSFSKKEWEPISEE